MLDLKLRRFHELTDDAKLKRIRELTTQREAIDEELAQLLGIKKRKKK